MVVIKVAFKRKSWVVKPVVVWFRSSHDWQKIGYKEGVVYFKKLVALPCARLGYYSWKQPCSRIPINNPIVHPIPSPIMRATAFCETCLNGYWFRRSYTKTTTNTIFSRTLLQNSTWNILTEFFVKIMWPFFIERSPSRIDSLLILVKDIRTIELDCTTLVNGWNNF